MTINDLIKQGRAGDIYVLARYLYRIGEPCMPDDLYDRLERSLKACSYQEYKDYFNRTYDDDPIPVQLLESIGAGHLIQSHVDSGLYKYLEEEKSNSIRPVRQWEEVYEFVQANHGKRLMASIKLDGVNCKSLWNDNKWAVSLSRGRKGNSIDYSQGAVEVLPLTIQNRGIMRVTGEFYVSKDFLPALREKYDSSKYKTAKSAAISMLRVRHDIEDYKQLNFRAFYADGNFRSVSEMYQWMESQKFMTPPHLIVENYPTERVAFHDWLYQEFMPVMSTMADGLPSDGVVLEVDDLVSDFEEKNQYSERQIAIKFGNWDFGYEKGIITGIKIEQRRVYKSVRITIEPMVTKDGCNAVYINSYNPAILIRNGLKVGETVYFEKNSGAVNVLIHGKRVKDLIAKENIQDEEEAE